LESYYEPVSANGFAAGWDNPRSGGRLLHSKVLNDAAYFIVAVGKEKFQGSSVGPKQQAHF
jgi:hypothetical protein